MKRREFLGLLGGAASLTVTARAQQSERVWRIGMFFAGLERDDPEVMTRIAAFREALARLGWMDGGNVRVDYRWGGGDADLRRKHAAEMVALAPDLILAVGTASIASLIDASHTIPIVFVNVVDPVGSGYVASLARPGGNVTGFTQFEYRLSGKWLELLKELAPNMSQAAVVRDAETGPGIGQFAVIQALAPPGVELLPVTTSSADEIERAITAFARVPNGGIIVTAGGTAAHRDLVISLAARYRVPAVYPFRYYTIRGGLISYGPDSVEPTRRAAGYIDRILKGEKAADLPVQVPTKYELVINLKTAKALGLDVPSSLLARADEVIE
jgi:putative ABC transport system substrate-binding protein